MTHSHGPNHGPRLLRAVFVSLLAGCLCPPVFAGPSGPEDIPSELLVSDWKIGPFYARPTLEIDDLGYNSNPFNRADASAEGTGEFVPGLRLALPFGDNVFSVTQKFGYSWFSDSDQRRNWSSDTELRLSFLAGSMRVDLDETFQRTNNLFGVEAVSRQLRRDNVFRAQLTSDHEAGGYFEATFSHRLIRFDQDETLADGGPVAENFDRTRIGARFDLFLDMLMPGRLILGGDLVRNDFRFGGSSRDANGYFVYGGLRFDPERAWNGDLRIGYRRVELGSRAPTQLAGLGVDADLSIELGGRGRFELNGRRSSEYSEYSAISYASATRFGGGLFLPAGDAIAFDIGADFARLEYPLGLDSASFDGGYDYLGLRFDVHVPVGPDAVLILGLGHRELSSDEPGRAYDGITYNIGFHYGT